jgi:putative ABC transport system substrate-binding protein
VRRREFLGALGGGALAWPLSAGAQQPARLPTIGFLGASTPAAQSHNLIGFRQGLRQAGYVEGQNVHIAFRWAEGRYERFPELAAELAGLNVAVIVAFGGPAALAAIAATKTIPIVFSVAIDPVKLGLVASFNRPGGNATGVANLAGEVVGKQFELLHELLPSAAVMGLLVNPTSVNAETQLAAMSVARQAFGLQMVVQNASTERDLETAFVTFAQERTGALVIASDPFFYERREQLIELAARHALPAIYYDREYVADGGLISYGPSIADAYRQAGVFAGRILKGDKPSDLPVQQAVKIDLIVNLKTAKALGIEMPLSLLMRINEAIE